MHEGTHALIGTQRTVRAIRKVAAYIARSEIAAAKQLATVTATSPFAVTVDGTTVAVAAHHLNSYTPALNDRVVCEIYGRQIMVLGTWT